MSETLDSVFVLLSHVDYESTTLEGVFATKEAAFAAGDEILIANRYVDSVSVTGWRLGGGLPSLPCTGVCRRHGAQEGVKDEYLQPRVWTEE